MTPRGEAAASARAAAMAVRSAAVRALVVHNGGDIDAAVAAMGAVVLAAKAAERAAISARSAAERGAPDALIELDVRQAAAHAAYAIAAFESIEVEP